MPRPAANSRSAPANRRRAADQALTRWIRRADADLAAALADPRSRRPRFCDKLIVLCDGMAFSDPERAPEYARASVEIARGTGERHLIYRSLDVLVHAHVGLAEWDAAGALLAEYGPGAQRCCRRCRRDVFYRRADLAVEERDPDAALDHLDRALAALGDDVDAGALGRDLFVRSMAHYHQGRHGLAIAAAGRALLELPLHTPTGYFIDALGLLGYYLLGGGPGRDAETMKHLGRFRDRIRGVSSPTAVRTQLRWLEGAVFGRLGERRKARRRLDRTRQALLASGPGLQAVAVTADETLLISRRLHADSEHAIRRRIEACRDRLRLPEAVDKRLEKVLDVLSAESENVALPILELRSAFRVSVPGLLAERRLRPG